MFTHREYLTDTICTDRLGELVSSSSCNEWVIRQGNLAKSVPWTRVPTINSKGSMIRTKIKIRLLKITPELGKSHAKGKPYGDGPIIVNDEEPVVVENLK